MLYAGLTFGGHENLGLLVLTTVAVGLSAFLSWPSVARVLTKAVDPIGGIISYRRRRGLPPPGDVLPHEVEAPTKEPAP